MNTLDPSNPQPGVYRNVPAAAYHSLMLCSSTRLHASLVRSLRQVRAEMSADPKLPSAALRQGSAIHALILEPEANLVCRYSDFRGSNRGLAMGDYLAGLCPLNAADQEVYDQVAKSWRSDPDCDLFATLVDLCEDRELTLIWDDPESGVRCRARLDLYHGPDCFMGDIKSGKWSGDDDDNGRKIVSYGYHLQAELYRQGCEALGLPVPESIALLIVHTRDEFADFTVPEYGVIPVPEELLADARPLIRKGLARWAEAERTGHWPGRFDNDPQDPRIAPWLRRKMEEMAS